MTLEQMVGLADLHGGDLQLWPAADRLAAQALIGASPEAAKALHSSRALDRLLDAWPAPELSAALRSAIIASGPKAPPARRVLLWLTGAGLATGLAGVACGAVVATLTLGESRDEALVTAVSSETGGLIVSSAPVSSVQVTSVQTAPT